MADGGLGSGCPRLPPGWSASDESGTPGVRRGCRPGALGVTGRGRHRRFPGQHAGSGRRRDLGFGPHPGLHRRRGPGIANGFPLSVGHRRGTADEALIAGDRKPARGRSRTVRSIERSNSCTSLRHAMATTHAPGFCFYNDAALTIAALRQAEVRKVAHVDVDVHPPAITVAGAGYPTKRGRHHGQHRGVRGHRARSVAAGPLRGRARGGTRLPPRDTHHPVRRRLPPAGPVGRPEPDDQRPPNVVPSPARWPSRTPAPTTKAA